MAHRIVTHSLAGAAGRVPGLRRVPVVKLLAAAEIAALARDHFMRLEPDERRRLLVLLRAGRGRPRNLSLAERVELALLIERMQPRALAGLAVDRLSPVPLPRRLVYGPRRRASG
jgi:hypothetical protein